MRCIAADVRDFHSANKSVKTISLSENLIIRFIIKLIISRPSSCSNAQSQALGLPNWLLVMS